MPPYMRLCVFRGLAQWSMDRIPNRGPTDTETVHTENTQKRKAAMHTYSIQAARRRLRTLYRYT